MMKVSSIRRPLVAGNWKMNGLAASLDELTSIAFGAQELGIGSDAVICPPATLIAAAAARVKGSRLCISAHRLAAG